MWTHTLKENQQVAASAILSGWGMFNLFLSIYSSSLRKQCIITYIEAFSSQILTNNIESRRWKWDE